MVKNRWWLFIVLYIAGLSASLSQLKVIMIFGDIAGALNLTPAQIPWLMSVFAIAGVVLAIPGGAVLGRIGPKRLIMCLMASVIIGNLLGALAVSFGMLLVSRIIEGIAFALIIMVGVVLISQWFAGGNVGIAIGIFTTFPAVAAVISMNLTLPIVASLGLWSVWYIVAALGAIAFILTAIFIQDPKSEEGAGAVAALEPPSLGEAASNGKVWLLALCQGCVGFILFTFIPLYPELFMNFYNLDPATAGLYASINGISGIVFCILSGIIIDKFKNAPALIFVSFILLGVSVALTTSLGAGPATYVAHTIAVALFCGLIIPAVLYIAPSIARKPALIGFTVAFVNMIYFVGIFAGPAVVMGTIAGNWERTGVGAAIMVAFAALGAASMLVFMLASRKKA